MVAPESSFWASPDHNLKLMKSLVLKPSQAPIRKKCFLRSKIRFSKSCLKFIQVVKNGSQSLPKCRRMIWDQFPMSRMNSERFWRKWKFWTFQAFSLRFQAYFMHKSFRKWMQFWLFENFFKNEAFNQKSETVVLLRYIFTCFHDHGGARRLILSKPQP